MIDLVVYTALFGPDAPTTLPDPPDTPNAKFVCVTDRDQGFMGWTTFRLPIAKSPRFTARYAKLSSERLFPDVPVTIWQDASFTWTSDPWNLVLRTPPQTSMMAFAHPDRCRIRDEGAAVIMCQQAPADDVEFQVERYQLEGFDTDEQPQQVLTTTGLLLRMNLPEVSEFNTLWRQQMDLTLRDQLSVDYCAWRLGLSIGYWPGHYRQNAFVQYDRTRRIRT